MLKKAEHLVADIGVPDSVNPSTGTRARVLVVDDDERNLMAINLVLEDIAEVVTAQSGEEALRHVLKEDFPVILLDVLMPGMDGYETARLIRKREQSKSTPIIFLSAINKEDAHLERGYGSGAVDYIFKPFEPMILRSKVSVFVELFEMTRQIRQKAQLEQRLLEENVRANAEKFEAERALRRSEDRQEAILRSLPVCFHSRSITAPFGAIYVSDAVERLTGFPPSALTSDPGFGLSRVHPDDLQTVEQALGNALERGAYSCEFRWLCADNTYRHFLDQGIVSRDESGEPVEIVGTMLDITERKVLEGQLIHAQKLDAVGKLTGGIAHDFNNLLASVLSGLALIERRMQLTPEAERIVEMMRHAANQGTSLVARMLTFSRRQQLRPEAVAIKEFSDNLIGLVSPVIGGFVRLEWDIAPGTDAAFADPAQLELALMNLILNARDAMPDGGTITTSFRNQSHAQDVSDLRAGSYVVITVKDTGCGIAPENLSKVLEPFFTTKELGRGTGLGLSTAYGFAQQSNGALRIRSAVGRGTEIELWLPRAANESRAKPVAEMISPVTQAHADAHGSVLLVDDSASLRDLTMLELQDNGFEVVCASGGAEALALIEREPDRFSVIVTDYAMPMVSGLEVIRFARNLRSDWPAIMISGYAEASEITKRPKDVPLISKPFEPSVLVDAIHEAMRARQHGQLQAAV